MQAQAEAARGSAMEQKRPGGEMKSNDSSEPTKSQLLPLGSAWQELLTKPYFVPGVIAALALAAMWATLGDKSLAITAHYRGLPVKVPMYYVVVALMLTAGGAYAVYRMVGKVKAWWLMPAVVVFTAFLTMSTVMGVLQQLFGIAQPGSGDEGSVLFKFIYNIFRAALPEESLKAIPVAIGVYIGFKLMGRLNATHPARQLAVLEPLDGILIGAASGFGFAFAETVLEYVPRVMAVNGSVLLGLAELLKPLGYKLTLPAGGLTPDQLGGAIVKAFKTLADSIGYDRAAFEFQRVVGRTQSAGLELLLPRLVGNVFGHSAYAGIFGYFIGLAAIKPANRLKTIVIGLLIASALHALWNATASSAPMAFVAALAAFTGLAVVIIKARSISPERSQLIASQVLERPLPSRPLGQTMPRPVAAPVVPPAATPAEVSQAVAGRPATSTPPASITWDDDSNQCIIEIGSARIPASVGACVYERQAPGAHASRGNSIVAEVSANPNDPNVLGLKNVSDGSFHVTTADGQARDLAPGRSIRLERGLRVQIGDLTAHVR